VKAYAESIPPRRPPPAEFGAAADTATVRPCGRRRCRRPPPWPHRRRGIPGPGRPDGVAFAIGGPGLDGRRPPPNLSGNCLTSAVSWSQAQRAGELRARRSRKAFVPAGWWGPGIGPGGKAAASRGGQAVRKGSAHFGPASRWKRWDRPGIVADSRAIQAQAGRRPVGSLATALPAEGKRWRTEPAGRARRRGGALSDPVVTRTLGASA